MNFVERSNLWKKRRDNKITKQRESKVCNETDGCTFQPNILNMKKFTNTPSSKQLLDKKYNSSSTSLRRGQVNSYSMQQKLQQRNKVNNKNQVIEYNEVETEDNNDFYIR